MFLKLLTFLQTNHHEIYKDEKELKDKQNMLLYV
jgi:hypothetical protein